MMDSVAMDLEMQKEIKSKAIYGTLLDIQEQLDKTTEVLAYIVYNLDNVPQVNMEDASQEVGVTNTLRKEIDDILCKTDKLLFYAGKISDILF